MSSPVKTKKPRIPRYPVIEYLGRYEAWLIAVYGTRSWDYHSEKLKIFFRHFPGFKGVEDFTSPDVIAYRDWQIKRGRNLATLAMELKCAKTFWSWCIENQRLPLLNPCRWNDFKHLQKRKALLDKAEFERRTLAEIEITTGNKGAAILDANDYLTLCGWIAQPQPGPKGEGSMSC